ncbi:hypothetical protein, partial [uncultured Dubosiella sp.]|uniref:hypothetical protein n=1 Tax=uncultured Dubosiella sp. TaxID=1937011 RepID=UPI0027120A4B
FRKRQIQFPSIETEFFRNSGIQTDRTDHAQRTGITILPEKIGLLILFFMIFLRYTYTFDWKREGSKGKND